MWLEQWGQGRVPGSAEGLQVRLAQAGPSGHAKNSGLYKCTGSYQNVLKREYDQVFTFMSSLLLEGRDMIAECQSVCRKTIGGYCEIPDR